MSTEVLTDLQYRVLSRALLHKWNLHCKTTLDTRSEMQTSLRLTNLIEFCISYLYFLSLASRNKAHRVILYDNVHFEKHNLLQKFV
eukprot:g43077.t1